MKRLVAAFASLALAWPAVAAAAPPPQKLAQKPAMTRPAPGSKPGGKPPVQKPRPPGNKPGQRPPANKPGHPPPGHKPGYRPPANKPGHPPPGHKPGYRPPGHRPGHRPPHWSVHKPRPHHFYRRGAWFVRIHGPVFHYPHGYAYRVWYPGQLFPLAILTSAIYFTAYVDAGLRPPPPGYQWVRWGPDLVLVNVHTGAIDDVIYGAFY